MPLIHAQALLLGGRQSARGAAEEVLEHAVETLGCIHDPMIRVREDGSLRLDLPLDNIANSR